MECVPVITSVFRCFGVFRYFYVPSLILFIINGRNCYGPILTWADFVMGRIDPEPPVTLRTRLPCGANTALNEQTFWQTIDFRCFYQQNVKKQNEHEFKSLVFYSNIFMSRTGIKRGEHLSDECQYKKPQFLSMYSQRGFQ